MICRLHSAVKLTTAEQVLSPPNPVMAAACMQCMHNADGSISQSASLQGDNDPVDVVEIGTTQCERGGVYKVKPLGAYAMIDDGELDWKIVCIRTDDPKADVLNDIEDVER